MRQVASGARADSTARLSGYQQAALGAALSRWGANHPGRQVAVLHLERHELCLILELAVVSRLKYQEHYTRLWKACNITETRSWCDSSLRLSYVCDHSSAHPSLMLARRVAYLSPADNVSRPLPYRLRRLNQPVMSSPNGFSIPRSTLLSSIGAHASRSLARSSTGILF